MFLLLREVYLEEKPNSLGHNLFCGKINPMPGGAALAAQWVRERFLGVMPARQDPVDLPEAVLAESGLEGDSTVSLRLSGGRITRSVGFGSPCGLSAGNRCRDSRVYPRSRGDFD